MAITLHFLCPILAILWFVFSALHNSSGSDDIRVVNGDAFSNRFDDDLDSLIRDGVVRVYRNGTNIYKWLSRLCIFGAVVTYLWQLCLLFNL